MFYHICGDYVYREENFVVLDCGGVGYKLTVSQTTLDAIGMPGASKGKVKLLTYYKVSEDDVELFGFAEKDELDAFRLLIAVSGVGPKAAMSILSLLSPAKLALAVSSEDVKAISRANGIGPKTAARVVLELKDKMGGFSLAGAATALPGVAMPAQPAPSGGKLGEATDALTALGYSRAEVADVLRRLDTSKMTVEQIIMNSLKYFSK